MATRPPTIIVRVIGWLIPPSCREEVLGDVQEVSASPAEFLLQAAKAIPFVIFSRIRRTSDTVIRFMEGMALYTSFVLAAGWLDRGLLNDSFGFLRLAVPSVSALATLMFADAYADPRKRSPLRPLFGPILGLAVAVIMQPALGEWALPETILFYGGAVGVVLISTLRLIFPPIADRPQLARIPALWQKLELAPFYGWFRPMIVVAILLVIAIARLLKALK